VVVAEEGEDGEEDEAASALRVLMDRMAMAA